jgi:hypothetical protein
MSIEKTVDKYLADTKNSTALNPAKFNAVVSIQLDKLSGILEEMKQETNRQA